MSASSLRRLLIWWRVTWRVTKRIARRMSIATSSDGLYANSPETLSSTPAGTTPLAAPAERLTAATNIYERFQLIALTNPIRPAVVLQGKTNLTVSNYETLLADADRVATWLAQEAINVGERCALLAENQPRWCAAYLGALQHGAAVVPLDINQSPQALADMLRDSGSRVLFTSRKLAEKAQLAVSATGQKIVLLEDDCDLAGILPFPPVIAPAPALPRCPAGPEDLAVLLYTSGTTNEPKGVELTHGNLMAVLDGVMAATPSGPQDNILAILPLFHIVPQITGLLLPLSTGATVVMLSETSTAEVMRAFRERGITAFCCVPQFFYLIHQRLTEQISSWGSIKRQTFRLLLAVNGLLRDSFGLNLGRQLFRPVHEVFGPQMRLLVTGSARFDPAIGRELHKLGFQILQGYGLTECGGVATITRLDDNPIGSVGRPLAGVEIKIAGARQAGNVGEVLVRGPNVMPAYHARPVATAAALHGGWLHTGDLGRLDRRGHLYITGRAKDVIVLSSGKNVYPEEVEAHYQRSPFIKEICVVSKQTQLGQARAEQLHCIVVPDMELMRQHGIGNVREKIRYELDNRSALLPAYQRVLSFQLHFADLPRTTTRKLKRSEAQTLVTYDPLLAPRAWLDEERAWCRRPQVQQALKVIDEGLQAHGRAVHPLDRLDLDLGLDSLGRVELTVRLEQAFAVTLPNSALQEAHTVRDMVDTLLSAPAARRHTSAPAEVEQLWHQVFAEGHESARNREQLPDLPLPWTFFLFLMSRVLGLLFRFLFRLRVTGTERLAGAPTILCPNHQSYLDSLLIISVLPWRLFRQLFFVSKPRYFNTSLRRWLARACRIILVDADSNVVATLQLCAVGLKQGKVLLIFPEGERTVGGALRPFRKGVAILSAHTSVPLIPVAIDGAFKVWPRGQKIQRLSKVKLNFGLPIPAVPVSKHCAPAEADAIYCSQLARLTEQVGLLLGELRRKAQS